MIKFHKSLKKGKCIKQLLPPVYKCDENNGQSDKSNDDNNS